MGAHCQRSAFCAPRWLRQTPRDIRCCVVQLQQPARKSNDGHPKLANLVVERDQKNKKRVGLQFAPSSYPAGAVGLSRRRGPWERRDAMSLGRQRCAFE